MDFDLSYEQRRPVDAVRCFIADELAPLDDEVKETGALAPGKARAILKKSRTLGLYAMGIPEPFGGGLSALDTMPVEEQLGRTTDIRSTAPSATSAR